MVMQRSRRQGPSIVVPLALALALCGCATTGSKGGGDHAQNDPFEPLNRHIFAANVAIDHAVIRPVAVAYRDTLPQSLRDRIRSILDNMHEPLVFINDVLQGRGEAAGISYNRFVINTTLGIGGLFDRAADFGLPRQSGDFGQTLYAWGLDDGPYLVLPLFGPSNIRDAVGLGVDGYASPVGHIGSSPTRREISLSTGVVDGVDLRSRNIEALDSIEANSLDFYAYLRSASRQNRQATLREAREGPPPPDDLIDPGATPAATDPVGSPAAPLPSSLQPR